jgi:hypothetical protein
MGSICQAATAEEHREEKGYNCKGSLTRALGTRRGSV